MITKATGLAMQVRWALDITGAPSALLLTGSSGPDRPVRHASRGWSPR